MRITARAGIKEGEDFSLDLEHEIADSFALEVITEEVRDIGLEARCIDNDVLADLWCWRIFGLPGAGSVQKQR